MFGRDSPANACFDMLLVTMFYGLISWLSRKYWICHPYMSNFLKSGIGSCIAPKAGLARHPAKGKFDAVNAIRILGFWCSIQLVGAPDQGAAGVTWLFRRQAKRARVQATHFILLYSYGIGVNILFNIFIATVYFHIQKIYEKCGSGLLTVKQYREYNVKTKDQQLYVCATVYQDPTKK